MILDIFALASLLVGLAILVLLWRRTGGDDAARLKLLLEQNLAAQRAEAETTRREGANSERALGTRLEALRLESKDSMHALAVRLGPISRSGLALWRIGWKLFGWRARTLFTRFRRG